MQQQATWIYYCPRCGMSEVRMESKGQTAFVALALIALAIPLGIGLARSCCVIGGGVFGGIMGGLFILLSVAAATGSLRNAFGPTMFRCGSCEYRWHVL